MWARRGKSLPLIAFEMEEVPYDTPSWSALTGLWKWRRDREIRDPFVRENPGGRASMRPKRFEPEDLPQSCLTSQETGSPALVAVLTVPQQKDTHFSHAFLGSESSR